MKRLSLLLLILSSTIFGAFASAPFRLDIDDPARIDVDINGQHPELVAGLNSFDIAPRTYVRVSVAEGCLFTAIDFIDDYDHSETSWLARVESQDGRQFIDLYSNFPDDEWFRVRTASAGDTRTASATITIDRPDQIKAFLGASDQPLDLKQGQNTVKFDPITESKLTLTPVERQPYLVEHNGNAVTAPYSYTITLAEGDNVNVQWAYPDKDCTVIIDITGAEVADFITAITADGKTITDWLPTGEFTVKAGSTISIAADLKTYEVNACVINGQNEVFTAPMDVLIADNTTITVEVSRYASFDVTINIDDPEAITVYRGYANNGDIVTLSAGANIVEIARAYPFLTVKNNLPKYLKSCSFAIYEYDEIDLKGTEIAIGYLADGNTVNFTTATLSRDLEAMIFIDSTAQDAFHLSSSLGIELDKTNGYHALAFDPWEMPLTLDARGETPEHVYVNDQLQSSLYPESQTYEIEAQEDDVIKIFIGDEPVSHSVTVKIDPELADLINITKDYKTPVTATESSHTVLHGTHLVITGDTHLAEITAEGADIAETPEKAKIITITAPTEVVISRKGQGISAPELETATKDIFNLKGLRVAHPEKGIYIINGSKTAIN